MSGYSMYSKRSVVIVDVFTKIMQELIAHSKIAAPIVFNRIQGSKSFKSTLKPEDFGIIQTMLTDDYSRLDISILYKIARFFNLIDEPSRKWGSKPLPHEREIGDDVERIRWARNELVHKYDCNYSEKEMNDFFSEFIEVGERVDKYLQKPIDSGFKVLIQSYQVCSIDEDMEKKYTEIVQQMEQLKEKFRVKTDEKEVRIYYSKSLEDVIQDIRNLGSNHASSSTAVKIIITGIEDPEEKALLLNSVKEEINRGAFDIEFKSAHEGSLILYVDIKNELFEDDNRSAFEISAFIQQIFRIGELTFLPQDANEVIMTIDEADLFDNDDAQADDAENLYYNSGKLVLDIEVRNNVFLTDESMKTHLGRFVEKLMTKTNGSKIFQHPITTAVMEPGEPVKDDNANDAQSKQHFKRKIKERFKVSKTNFKLYVLATIGIVTLCMLYTLEIQTITYYLLVIVLFLLSVYATQHCTWETTKSESTLLTTLYEVSKKSFEFYHLSTIGVVILLYLLLIRAVDVHFPLSASSPLEKVTILSTVLMALALVLVLSRFETIGRHTTGTLIPYTSFEVEVLTKIELYLLTTICFVQLLYLLVICALDYHFPSSNSFQLEKLPILSTVPITLALVLIFVLPRFETITRHTTQTQIPCTNFKVEVLKKSFTLYLLKTIFAVTICMQMICAWIYYFPVPSFLSPFGKVMFLSAVFVGLALILVFVLSRLETIIRHTTRTEMPHTNFEVEVCSKKALPAGMEIPYRSEEKDKSWTFSYNRLKPTT